jgi:hypothetical protein
VRSDFELLLRSGIEIESGVQEERAAIGLSH